MLRSVKSAFPIMTVTDVEPWSDIGVTSIQFC